LLAIFLGVGIGTITGIIPGIHVNLLAVLTLSVAPALMEVTSPLAVAVFIIALTITHIFTDFVPSTFLGAPTPDTALNILPSHELLLKGQGYKAVYLATQGAFMGIIVMILLTPLYLITIKPMYGVIQAYIPFILILSSSFLILRERKEKLWALAVFLLSGILGVAALNLSSLKQPLLPLFSGLFGTSTLLLALKEKINIPKQEITKEKIPKKEFFKAMGGGTIASTLCGFLPAMGSAQAVIIASSIFKQISRETFIILVGMINSMVTVLSFVALYTIDKARNGAVAILSQVLANMTLHDLMIYLICALVAGILAMQISNTLAKVFAKIITKINYTKLCLAVIIFTTAIVFLFSHWLGLLVLTVSTMVGMLAPMKGLGRYHLMGSLSIPVILYFLL